MYFVKIKNLSYMEDTIKRMKLQVWETIWKSQIRQRAIRNISRTYQEYSKPNSKKTNN